MKKVIIGIIALIVIIITIVAATMIGKNATSNTIPYEELPQENVNVKEPTTMKQV